MKEIRLKRCPFCGGEANFAVSRDGVYVCCMKCMVQTPHTIDFEAGENAMLVVANIWNRRTIDGVKEG